MCKKVWTIFKLKELKILRFVMQNGTPVIKDVHPKSSNYRKKSKKVKQTALKTR